MSEKQQLIINESDLYELYSLLADATEAHAAGNPNGCASLASDAKEKVIELRENADVVRE